ncbi:ketopantoate hydroxymethyltransferase [Sporosarcina sp. FSL K6-2383]|uniref:ketopantoate hydroxymethyltransferase n=1 Tax=Sporosarcina sp. FSL K6-2383 TaxID=2921556 RepID=UPI003159A067
MIPTAFQSDIASFVESQIAKVQINGTFDITNFIVKSVVGNKVNMSYEIPFGSVAEVKTMALLKAGDQVISINDVYLPISSDTNITHTFTILEVG